ncbi:ferredoxin [Actinocatenispora thailandica]|uniref:Ferredoxin n=1 Tax=Actinocatenispora thailandica TaxID=227318 RepID=A0A7R7DKX2_9ACTN|nr:ferredoxin [Actinocatenispora thailandica]BCJ33492.1 ferredoxin [Actinocatenispora thailandica]
MQVSVDQEACVSSGQCALTADDVFDQRDSDGVVELLDADPPQGRWRDVRDAAAHCPAMAITVRE